MNNGWIKIQRSICEHWIWQNQLKLKWWLDLLLMAAHKPTKINIGNTLVELERGQLVASIRFLQQRWQYKPDPDDPRSKILTPSVHRVISFLELLESDNMIIRENNCKKVPKAATLITIVNYDKYQAVNEDYKVDAATIAATIAATPAATIAATKTRTKEEKNITDDDDVNAREQEKNWESEFRNSPLKQQEFCKSLGVDQLKCLELAEAVFADWGSIETTHDSRANFFYHLLATMRSKQSIEKQERQKQQRNGNNNVDSKAKWRAETAAHLLSKLASIKGR